MILYDTLVVGMAFHWDLVRAAAKHRDFTILQMQVSLLVGRE